MSSTDLERIHEFTSLVIASTRSPRQRERLQRALGLSLSDTNLGVLRLVQRQGPVAVSEVARRLEVDLSNASRQLRVLEDQGLVTRAADPDDRRVARVAVTAAGRASARPGARGRAQRLRGRARRLVGARPRPARDLLDRFRTSLLATEPDESGWAVTSLPDHLAW